MWLVPPETGLPTLPPFHPVEPRTGREEGGRLRASSPNLEPTALSYSVQHHFIIKKMLHV